MATRPKATGIVAWKAIAPVTLPVASVSLPSRTHRIEFAFSGSSVASGASTSESTSGATPIDSAMLSTAPTKSSAPATIAASETTNWRTIWSVDGGSSLLVSKYSGASSSSSDASPLPRTVSHV